jgi:hypothetical protein
MSASELYDETSIVDFSDIKSESCSVGRYKFGRYLEYGPGGVRCSELA